MRVARWWSGTGEAYLWIVTGLDCQVSLWSTCNHTIQVAEPWDLLCEFSNASIGAYAHRSPAWCALRCLVDTPACKYRYTAAAATACNPPELTPLETHQPLLQPSLEVLMPCLGASGHCGSWSVQLPDAYNAGQCLQQRRSLQRHSS